MLRKKLHLYFLIFENESSGYLMHYQTTCPNGHFSVSRGNVDDLLSINRYAVPTLSPITDQKYRFTTP